MDPLTTGADVATMAGGLSVVTATLVWGRKQWREFQAERAQRKRRNWHGYIGDINEWFVRVAEDDYPDLPDGRVVLDVLGSDRKPHGNQAQNLRTVVERDGQIARVPTPHEWAFLRHLRKLRANRDGYPVRYGELAHRAEFTRTSLAGYGRSGRPGYAGIPWVTAPGRALVTSSSTGPGVFRRL